MTTNKLISGRVSRLTNGRGFVIADTGGRDLFLSRHQMRRVLHNDRVLVRALAVNRYGRRAAEIVEVIIDPPQKIIGNFYIESGVGFVEPLDTKYATDIIIPLDQRGAARSGDIVVVTITRHPSENHNIVGQTIGAIVEVIGDQFQAGLAAEIAIRKYEIPTDWPPEVDIALKKIGPQLNKIDIQTEKQQARIDLRDLPLVTIDGESARDFDDAVYATRCDSGWRLVVAIADVGYYVKTGDALDTAAAQRANSVYFPNRVVPMLPTQLSNGICSLNPNQDRYCMVCDMQLSASGAIKNYQFYPGVMRSAARLTYAIVNRIITRKNSADVNQWKNIVPYIDNLYSVFKILFAYRKQRGTIDFELPATYVEFDSAQKVKNIIAYERNAAHRLIEECMLAANICAAQFLHANLNHATIYRNHLPPSSESLLELRKFLSVLGLQLSGGNNPQAGDYANLLAGLTESTTAMPVQLVLLRSLQQANYATEPAGHFALGFKLYTHFTSPIRRYPDLIVHRQIRTILDKSSKPIDDLKKIATHCSVCERRAEEAERDVLAQLKAEYMQDKVGEIFYGIICAVKEFGLFVQLQHNLVDGLVHVSSLADDYYLFDEQRMELTGRRFGITFKLGMRVQIRVIKVNLTNAKIDFELADMKKLTNNKNSTIKKFNRKNRFKSSR